MIDYRHPLYAEFEKEGYYFYRVRLNAQISLPKVVNENNLDDWCSVNPTVTINGQAQVEAGPECSQKTVQMLQRFIDELNKCNGQFVDYDFTKKVEEN
jgi:hypothetical protein